MCKLFVLDPEYLMYNYVFAQSTGSFRIHRIPNSVPCAAIVVFLAQCCEQTIVEFVVPCIYNYSRTRSFCAICNYSRIRNSVPYATIVEFEVPCHM